MSATLDSVDKETIQNRFIEENFFKRNNDEMLKSSQENGVTTLFLKAFFDQENAIYDKRSILRDHELIHQIKYKGGNIYCQVTTSLEDIDNIVQQVLKKTGKIIDQVIVEGHSDGSLIKLKEEKGELIMLSPEELKMILESKVSRQVTFSLFACYVGQDEEPGTFGFDVSELFPESLVYAPYGSTCLSRYDIGPNGVINQCAFYETENKDPSIGPYFDVTRTYMSLDTYKD